MNARVYLDEDVIPELARLLRARGFDAISAHETGSIGESDEQQLQKAVGEGRVLLTYNYEDFLRLFSEWLAAGRNHAGIVISYRQYSRDELRPLADTVERLLNTLTAIR